jgi:hypothetical protein
VAAPANEAKGGAPKWSKELCITLGQSREVDGLANGHAVIDSAKARGVVLGSRGDAIELEFVYLGATSEQSALRSGEIRRQLGVKLHAADSCNVVYAMWRLAPGSSMHVSVKRNERAHRHEDCGTDGYETLKPLRTKAMPVPEIGRQYRLRAAMEGDNLLVWLDGEEVWAGEFENVSSLLDGPAGFRTDNAALEIVRIDAPRLEKPDAASTAPMPEVKCRQRLRLWE